jgi:peptidylprolyl isomerase
VVILRLGVAAEAFRPDTPSFLALRRAGLARIERENRDRVAVDAQWMQKNWPEAAVSANGRRDFVREFGIGGTPPQGATVTARYKAETRKGVRFRSTADGRPALGETGEVFTHVLGARGVPVEVDRALAGMTRGEVRVVLLPPELGYGTSGHYAPDVPGLPRLVIPPNSAIAYELELVDF